MKIPASLTSPPQHTHTVKKGEENQADKNANDVSKSKTSAQHIEHNAQRITQLFARVGITTNLYLSTEKERRTVTQRRRDIMALQKVKNLSAVMDVALSVTQDEASQENVDPDWFFAFTQLAENIYSPAMQELWGKIFAVEVSRPGSFSMRSLETLKALTQRDARLFTKAASIASRRSGNAVPRILLGYHQRPGLLTLFGSRPPESLNLSQFGLSYPDMLALTDMKLIFASEIESGELSQDTSVEWRCGQRLFTLTPKKSGLALVYYKFTAVGGELYKLINRQDASAYVEALKIRLASGFKVD